MSGTNVHLILEQAPEQEAAAQEEAPDGAPVAGSGPAVVPWVLSAKSEQALKAQAERLLAHVRENPGTPVGDVGYSLALTRTAFNHRAAVVAAGREDLETALASIVSGAPAPAVVSGVAGRGTRPVFVFPGQGAQWAGMAVELLDTSPVFAARMTECAAALAPHTDWSLLDVVRSGEGLERVDVVQPVLWAVMVSLAELWRSYGVQPAAVIGHSQGEIAAAAVAGILSLEDAAKVVALRSRAITALAGLGGMVSVARAADAVREVVAAWDGRISVAAVNGPSSTVVSGDVDALDEFLVHCQANDIRARRVDVDYASHSAHVEAIRDELARLLEGVTPRQGTTPLYSSLTGRLLDAAETAMDGGYWYDNLRGTVEFENATRAALADGHGVFVEVSPHPVLAVGLQGTVEDVGAAAAVLGTLRRDEGGPERFLTSLAEAHCHGVAVDWETVFAGTGARRTGLPTYPFQRRHFWPDPPALGAFAPVPSSADPSDGAPDGGAVDEEEAAVAGREFAARLREVPAAERHWALLGVVTQHAAAVLGHASADVIETDTNFLEQGFDSLTALRLRNNLRQALGVDLSATLLFDHPTPVRLARHLAVRVLGGDEEETPRETAAESHLLGELFRHSRDTGRPAEYTELLINLASFRPVYDDHTALETPHRAVPLSGRAGGEAPALISCCTMSMLSGAHEYARLAAGFRGARDVYALPHPGFSAGQPLPADLGVLTRTHADTVLRTVGDAPFVLTGHSGGAMVANVLSLELARQGRPPAAVVLMDSYPFDSPVLVDWIPQMLDGMVERDTAFTPMDDYRTTAWAAYLRFFSDWKAQLLDVPTLLVRADTPLGTIPQDGDWHASWPHPHDVLDVPGDHFTMLGDHSEDVAKRIQEWLADRGL
ncbi:acyl transferase domain-containing protein [Streptomyces sp. MJP52]|nr:acyl transferase domain-containing protein [Streptomyces sp. MJP52]